MNVGVDAGLVGLIGCPVDETRVVIRKKHPLRADGYCKLEIDLGEINMLEAMFLARRFTLLTTLTR